MLAMLRVCAAMRRLCVHVFRIYIDVWLFEDFFFFSSLRESLNTYDFICVRLCVCVCVCCINRWLFWGKLCIIPTAIIQGCRVCLQKQQTTPMGPSSNMFPYIKNSVWIRLPHTLSKTHTFSFSSKSAHTHTLTQTNLHTIWILSTDPSGTSNSCEGKKMKPCVTKCVTIAICVVWWFLSVFKVKITLWNKITDTQTACQSWMNKGKLSCSHCDLKLGVLILYCPLVDHEMCKVYSKSSC